MNKPSILHFISTFKNPQEKNLNINLIKRNNEDDLITFIVDAYKSLEDTGFITFLGYDVIDDESKIDFFKYITTRKKIKKKEADIKYQYIHPDRCIELILKFKVHVKDESTIISKSILVPRMDENSYNTIRGKRYFLLYQLVDNSTYTSRDGLTLKSLMPICVNKNMDTLIDVDGNVYEVPYYYINAFKRQIETFLFYFCKIGFRSTLKFFVVDKVISIIPDDIVSNDESHLYFKLNKNLTMVVNKYLFEKYLYIQSMALMVKRCANNKTTMNDLENKNYWIQRLGSLYTNTPYKLYESGKSTIAFFERLLDITTQKKLKLSNINKENIYFVVKWMVQNFMELKKKDNLDLNNKRLRLTEYISSLLTKRVNEGVNRILTLGNKIKMKQVRDVFKFPGTIIFQLLYSNPLLKYDNRVNDLDALSALRYSVRGPNSLGSRSDRNVSIKYRSCHPSMLGRLDLNFCSSSSPGLSGAISPFAKTDNLWFNSEKESENMEYEMVKATEEYYDQHPTGELRVKIDTSSPEKYYDSKYKLYENRQTFIAHYTEPDTEDIEKAEEIPVIDL